MTIKQKNQIKNTAWTVGGALIVSLILWFASQAYQQAMGLTVIFGLPERMEKVERSCQENELFKININNYVMKKTIVDSIVLQSIIEIKQDLKTIKNK